jgi:hypothetical protein
VADGGQVVEGPGWELHEVSENQVFEGQVFGESRVLGNEPFAL